MTSAKEQPPASERSGPSTDEQSRVVSAAREFARERFAARALELANAEEYPFDVFDELRDAGYFSLYFEERWGGLGFDLLTVGRVIEALAEVSNTVASLLLAQIQGTLPLVATASPEIAERYIPDLVAGKLRTATAITEPSGGSDVASMRTLATRDGDHFVINGQKCFITMAKVADLIVVYAKLKPGRSTETIQGFVVPMATPGVTAGRLEHKMGSSALPTGEVWFQDCRVPDAHRLGEAGSGFKQAMGVLDRMRALVGMRSVGLAQGAFDATVAYMKERDAFGRKLTDFQGLQFMIADMAMKIEASRGISERACQAVDAGSPDAPTLCAMAKCFATDAAMQVTMDAVQLLGGYGYMKDFPVEHRMREAKLAQIIDGTNQIQRLIIARSVLSKRR